MGKCSEPSSRTGRLLGDLGEGSQGQILQGLGGQEEDWGFYPEPHGKPWRQLKWGPGRAGGYMTILYNPGGERAKEAQMVGQPPEKRREVIDGGTPERS